jgi:L-methionine (R)-S-oxide reductase
MIKKQLFEYLIVKIKETVEKPDSRDKKLLNICTLLKANIPYYNWVGFYLVPEDRPAELILGPFVGEPTEHTRIPFGKGICGQAADRKKTFIVPDISRETNYLACNPHVRSEIVIPIIKDNRVIGELDIDSNTIASFTEADEKFLTEICQLVNGLY